MCGLFPCIPILGRLFWAFIFDQIALWEWRFRSSCETNPLGSILTLKARINHARVHHIGC